jgi:hypothetical protein
MIGPDALKWSWLCLVFGALLFADGFFNWGMFTNRKRVLGERAIRYGAFGRTVRMGVAVIVGLVGVMGLAQLAMSGE